MVFSLISELDPKTNFGLAMLELLASAGKALFGPLSRPPPVEVLGDKRKRLDPSREETWRLWPWLLDLVPDLHTLATFCSRVWQKDPREESLVFE